MITVLQGMVIGIAEVIPGVSGSTLALVMGIYDDLIDLLDKSANVGKVGVEFLFRRAAFADVIESIKSIPWLFAIKLGIGAAIIVVLFSHLLSELLHRYPQYVFGFFFGLLLASLIVPWREIKRKNIYSLGTIVFFAVATFILLELKPAEMAQTPSPLIMFIGGVLGVCGLVLPGVSGSFILLGMGIYGYIINLIRDLTKLSITPEGVINLIAFGTGLGVGFVLFIKLLKYLFNNYPDIVLSALLGMMFGSLKVVWPLISNFENGDYTQKLWPWQVQPDTLLFVTITVVIGCACVFVLSKFNKGELTKSWQQ